MNKEIDLLKKNKESKNEKIEEFLHLLPEYGKLNITNYNIFLEQCKKQFSTIWCETTQLNGILSDFIILKFINAGAFGTIYFSQNKSTLTYHAMKVLKKSEIIRKKQLNFVKNEKYVLQRMNFPFIVHLEYCFKDNSYIYLITPYYSGGDLFQLLKAMFRLKEHVSRFVAAQVALALEYLHKLDIIYRDLKPENIMFDHTGYIKVTDFGFSKVVNCSCRTYTICGTPHYLAPEILSNGGYGKSVDWWSFGILLYEMNSGMTPFNSTNIKQFFRKDYRPSYKMPPFFSSDLKNLISNILQVDISRRFGSLKNGVNDIKDHKWFRPILWSSVLNRKLESPFIPEEKSMNEYDSSQNIILKVSKINEFSTKFEDF